MNQDKKAFKNQINFATMRADNDNTPALCRFFNMQELKQHRQNIDEIDRKIAELLGQRFRIAEQVAEIKRENNIPVRIEKRITEVLENATHHEQEFDLPAQLGYFLWREIIESTCYHEEGILGMKNILS